MLVQGPTHKVMNISNIYHRPDPVETLPRVPFSSLRFGNKFQYRPNGPISQIYMVSDDHIMVKRWDDWLVAVKPGSMGWDKMVIKL